MGLGGVPNAVPGTVGVGVGAAWTTVMGDQGERERGTEKRGEEGRDVRWAGRASDLGRAGGG